jgi:predicted  nucleic acid-binding Zn-ribbon protein
MILSGNTSRALTWGGRFAVLALAAALLPLLPTWAEPPKGERQETTANDGDQGQVFNFWMGYFSESGDAARSDSPAAIAAPRTLRQALAQQIEAAQDEVELLQAQLDAKRAQLQAAKIELDSATKQLARLRRSSGVPEVAAAAEGKINTMRAQVVIKEAELKEPEIRLKQARRRLEKLREQAARADGKRQTGQAQQGRNGNSEARHKGLEARLAIAQSDLEMWEERAAWSARMAKRGLVTEPQAKADAAKLRAAKTTYDKLREELHSSANKDADKEKRLADLEKKLDALMKEIESLRRELKRPQSALPPGQPFNVNPFAEGQPYQIVPAPKVPGSAVPNPEFKVVPYDPTRPNPKYADPRDTPTVPLKPPTGEPRQH